MKFLWYLISLVLIILILINNPKAEGLGNLSSQNQLFTTNRTATSFLEVMTWISIVIFLCFTVILTAYYES